MFFWIIVGLVLAVTLAAVIYATWEENIVGGMLAGISTLFISSLAGGFLLLLGTLFFDAKYEKVETSTKPITPVTEGSFLVQDSTHVVFREETGLTNELVYVPLASTEVKTTSGDPSVETTVLEASNPWHSPFVWSTKYAYVINIPEASQ